MFLEREVIGLKGLKQNDSSSTRAVKIARRTLDASDPVCADKFTFQVIQVREQVFDTRTTSEKEDRQSSTYFSFPLLGDCSLESLESFSVRVRIATRIFYAKLNV